MPRIIHSKIKISVTFNQPKPAVSVTNQYRTLEATNSLTIQVNREPKLQYGDFKTQHNSTPITQRWKISSNCSILSKLSANRNRTQRNDANKTRELSDSTRRKCVLSRWRRMAQSDVISNERFTLPGSEMPLIGQFSNRLVFVLKIFEFRNHFDKRLAAGQAC